MSSGSTEDREPPPGTWKPARAVANAIASPIQRMLAIEAASGILLMIATGIALFLANSQWHADFEDLWHTSIGITIGEMSFQRSLHFWINDGLMTIFFFVVGLEIRREIAEGELQTLKRAALPLMAAIGGMIMPAAIYVALNAGKSGMSGWAIPMATDIAFAVGVLTLLGSRVPKQLHVLLLALAVIDDIGAIVVIALFYSGGVAPYGLALAGVGVAGALAMRFAAVRTPLLYVVPGVVVWAGFYMAGLHPTLAGVLLGLLTPVVPWFGPSGFAETTKTHLDRIEKDDRDDLLARLDEINAARKEAVSPVDRLIHVLHPWVAFGVMPVFALANAGVPLGGADLSGDGFWVFVGIIAGLAVGKPIGIAGLSLLSSKLRIASRPADMRASGIALVGVVGGIGFTMSLFIAQLAFADRAVLDTAKLAVLAGSATAMIFGIAFGMIALRKRPV